MMHELSWKTKYETGNSLIDREHKELFEIAQEAFTPVLPEERKQKVRETIMKLNEYMKVHFTHEEHVMKSIEYPHLQEHQKIHQEIIESNQELINSLANTELKDFEKKLAYFVDTALVGHIIHEDIKIHKWYEAKQGQKHVVEWDEEYTLGNAEIDKEHKELFVLANETFAMSHNGANKVQLKEIVMKLLEYFKNHFEHEENYMKGIGYPRFEYHQKLHQNIIHSMNEFMQGIKNMDTQTFELELALLIEKYLIGHIIHEDMRMKHFLNGDDKMSIILDDK